MSKLMWIAGILLIAAALALGLMFFASPASVGWLTFETVAILLVGGVLSLGLGSVISGLAMAGGAGAAERSYAAAPPPVAAVVPPPAAAAVAASAAQAIPEFGRRASETPVQAAPALAGDDRDEISAPTRQTIEALEQARKSIDQAFGPASDEPSIPPARPLDIAASAPAVTAPAPAAAATTPQAEPEEEAPAEEPAEEAEIGDGQLYVVEERIIRMHPARILSDGTVEAETSEGWMRFENLEHLDEYLDAMEPAKA